MNATGFANQDFEDKYKHKSVKFHEINGKRQPRLNSKRSQKWSEQNNTVFQAQNATCSQFQQAGQQLEENLTEEEEEQCQDMTTKLKQQKQGIDILSNINCKTGHIENIIQNKGDLGHSKVMSNDAVQFNMAPTTVESKDILQQHQSLQQFMSIASERPQQTNLGLITPNMDSSTIKTLQTTNNIRDLINNQNQHANSIFNTLQVQNDLGLGISAAANSLLRNTNIINQHNQLKRPLDQSNQKSKPSEKNVDQPKQRLRNNRVICKQQEVLQQRSLGFQNLKQGLIDPASLSASLKKCSEGSSLPKDKPEYLQLDSGFDIENLVQNIALNKMNCAYNQQIGNQIQQLKKEGANINQFGGAETTIGIKSAALRKNNEAIQQQLATSVGRKTKDTQLKQNKRNKNQLETNKNLPANNITDMAKTQRNKRISKQQLKDTKTIEHSDQIPQLTPSSGGQLKFQKQSGKKTGESKQPISKPLQTKKRVARTSRNTRDKSKDRSIENNGCAIFDDSLKRKSETTVTILKQVDDYAQISNTKNQAIDKAQNLSGNQIISLKKQKKEQLNAKGEDNFNSQLSSSDEGDQRTNSQQDVKNNNINTDIVIQQCGQLVGGMTGQNSNASKSTIQNQLEQLIAIGLANGAIQNSNSITESDKNVQNQLNNLETNYELKLNQLPISLGFTQMKQGEGKQNNLLGLQLSQSQMDWPNRKSMNDMFADIKSKLANYLKNQQLNNQQGSSTNFFGPLQFNQNEQSKSQLGFKIPGPMINMAQNQKINYDDSDFNNGTQLRGMPGRSNSIQKKETKNQVNGKGQKNNEQTNSNLMALFNAREQDMQQQAAKKAQAELQITQQAQAVKAAGLDELDPFTQRYQILKEVGRGAFGSVFKALDLKQATLTKSCPATLDNFVAIKKLFYDRKYEQREVPMLVEIKNKKLNDNIIRLKDRYLKQCSEVNQKKPWQRIQKEYLFIVTDYLPHTICDLNVSPSIYLSPNGQETAILPSNVSPQQMASAKAKCLESIRQVMNGVFKGLRDLHSIGITHRDIKLSNILLDNDRLPIQRVKICDLGSSKKLQSDPNDQSTQSLNYIGTRSFRAPELLVGNRYYDTKIDIWSAGVVFLKLLLGFLNKKSNLFNVSDSKGLAKVIVEQIGDPTEAELKEMLASNDLMSNSIKAGLSEQDIMRKRFKKLDQQMKSQIPSDAIDFLHKILQLSPVRRLSAAEALLHPYFNQEADRKESVQKLSMINRTTETTSPCTNPNTLFFNNHSNQPN